MSSSRKIQLTDFKWIFNYQTLFITGVLLLFMYFVKIQYYPIGFELDNTIAIFLVVFGFGIIVMISLLFLSFAPFLFYLRTEASNASKKWEKYFHGVICMFVVFLISCVLFCMKLYSSLGIYLLFFVSSIVVIKFDIDTDTEAYALTFIMYISLCFFHLHYHFL